MDHRPDPDQLLKQVQKDEAISHKGRLKLFFGASPGVGKTYAMLEAARQRKKEGWDVVVGLVETHKRAETEALLEGLEILSRKDVFYKGVILKEFDLDGALARKPRLILVDELAHTNAPGLRHAKRWQDIEELLEVGIDVYTTINVQHWETLNDVVAQITGVTVRETVPDTFLKKAHELELVDLAPEDLLRRLKEGKVYKDELAGRAAENFFQTGNLIALRELALRHAAERVDAQMQAFKVRHAIDEVWPVGEKILVGVSSSPLSPRLIRAAGRMATRLHASWIALHVETPAFLQLPQEERARAINNLRMAEKLGAETVTITGESVTEELIRFAHARNVTQLILGKPARSSFRERLFGSLINDIARRCGNIDLHVISGVGGEFSDRRVDIEKKESEKLRLFPAVGVVALCTLICWPFVHTLDRVNLVMFYLLGVIFTAYQFGHRASLLASILSVLAFDFFFVPPFLTFAVSDTQYILTFIIMLGVGLFISTLTKRLRRQTNTLRERAERMHVLYKLSRELSETPDLRDMVNSAQKRLEEFYGFPVLILIVDLAGKFDLNNEMLNSFGVNESSVAKWVFERAQMAGAGSDTLSGAKGLYLPLKGIKNNMGVLGLYPADSKVLLSPDQLQLLETFASEIGGALESTRMSESMGRAEMQMELQALNTPLHQTGLQLTDIFSKEKIVFLASDSTKEDIFRELISKMKLENPGQALQAVLSREKNGETLLGDSIAAPHARIPGLKKVEFMVGITKEAPVKVWVLFLSPAHDSKLHLSFLRDIATLFKDSDSLKRISEFIG